MKVDFLEDICLLIVTSFTSSQRLGVILLSIVQSLLMIRFLNYIVMFWTKGNGNKIGLSLLLILIISILNPVAMVNQFRFWTGVLFVLNALVSYLAKKKFWLWLALGLATHFSMIVVVLFSIIAVVFGRFFNYWVLILLVFLFRLIDFSWLSNIILGIDFLEGEYGYRVLTYAGDIGNMSRDARHSRVWYKTGKVIIFWVTSNILDSSIVL